MPSNFTNFEKKLWISIDRIRTNSKISISDYSTYILGLVFLRFADIRFTQSLSKKTNTIDSEPLLENIYPAQYKDTLHLPETARFSYLLKSPQEYLGKIIDEAMQSIELKNVYLKGALPKGYTQIEKEVLTALLNAFASIPNDIELSTFNDVYEYFLDKLAVLQGYKGGEFFTPTSIVKLIVDIVEPLHGTIFDPTCGSGGFFIHSAKFAKSKSGTDDNVTFFGQELNRETVHLCRMNLAIHNLSGEIQQTNSLYENVYNNIGRFDYVMANPPFNLKILDKERIKDDPRYLFGLPKTSNANYLWIQQFYSALSSHGRAGFVMANSAGDARFSELTIRRQLIEANTVDIVISLGSNFLYAMSLPCTLWFLDKSKIETKRKDQVLFIDARKIYEQVDRIHRDLTPAKLEFIANVVRLYRGDTVEATKGSKDDLQEKFPHGMYIDVPGLCKVAALTEIESRDWSLNPSRYVEPEKRIVIPTIERTKVFVSYCHHDKQYIDRLRIHLASFKKKFNIDIWDDTKIKSGEEWHKEIDRALSCAKVAILLVSADFLASEFIAEDELPPLLKAAKEEKAIILPVILGPCAFKDSQLADFQSVNDPEKPLSGMSKNNRERIWDKVAQRISETFK